MNSSNRKLPGRLTAFGLGLLLVLTLAFSAGSSLAYMTGGDGPLNNHFPSQIDYDLVYHDNVADEEIAVPAAQSVRTVAPEQASFTISTMVPQREGWNFVKWTLTESGTGTAIAAGSTYTTGEKHTDLYAQWEPRYQFHLVYEENPQTPEGGQTPATVSDMPDNEDVRSTTTSHDFTVSSALPTSTDNFVFICWNTEPNGYADGTGTNYRRGQTPLTAVIPDGQTEVTVTLYAQWIPGFVLDYDANGGTGAPDPQVAASSADSYTFDPLRDGIPTHPDGLKFLGWADTPDALDPVYSFDGTTLAVDADGYSLSGRLATDVTLTRPETHKTLYAVWGFRYILHFNDNSENLSGVSGDVPDTQIVYSKRSSVKFHVPEDPYPERSNYYWGYWSENIYHPLQGDELQVPAGGVYVVYREDPERTLYARFTPPERVRLIYDKNNAPSVSNMPSNITTSTTDWLWMEYLSSTTPNGGNWTFCFWSEDPDTSPYADPETTPGCYLPGERFELAKELDYEKTLYAIWLPPHAFRLVLNLNYPGGGTYMTYSDVTAKVSTTSVTWTRVSNNPYSTQYVNPTRANYDFLGWSLDPDATEPDYTLSSYKSYSTYYTQFSPALTMTCDGEHPSSTATNVHVTKLYAVWKYAPKHSFSLTFYRNFGSYSHQPQASSSSPSRSVTGSANARSVTLLYEGYSLDTRELTVSGVRAAPHYYNFSSDAPMLSYGSSPANPYYCFLGWSESSSAKTPEYPGKSLGTITISAGENCAPGDRHGKTFYAVWEPAHGYRIAVHLPSGFSLDYGSGSSSNLETIQELSVKSYTFENLYMRPYSRDMETAYRFLGWATLENSTTVVYPVTEDNRYTFTVTDELGHACPGVSGNKNIYHTLHLYPVFEGISHQYKLTFVGNGGVVQTGENSADVLSIQPFSVDSHTWESGSIIKYATRDGWFFKGWALTEDATEPDFPVDENNTITSDITVDNGHVGTHCEEVDVHELTLYAVWEPAHSFRLVIYYNNNRDALTAYNLPIVTLPKSNHSYTWPAGTVGHTSSRSNYTFLGWSTEQNQFGAENVMYHPDENGMIIEDVVLNVDDPEECENGTRHDLILYPVLEAQHRAVVYADLNGYGERWSNTSSTTTGFYSYSPYLPYSTKSYTFAAVDNTPRGSTYGTQVVGKTGYTFIGWSTNRNASDPVFGARSLTPTVSLDHTCSITSPHNHQVTYYAVYEAKYELNFNGRYSEASGLPANLSATERKNDSGVFPVHTYTIPDVTPTYRNFVFMGWVTNTNTVEPTYGYPCDPSNEELYDIMKNASPTINISPGSNYRATLYALWYYEYQLNYNGNADDITSLPALSHAYSSGSSMGFKLSDILPERNDPNYDFVGWSLDPNAQPGDEGIMQPGSLLTIPGGSDGYAEVTIYAVWAPKRSAAMFAARPVNFELTYDQNGGEVFDCAEKLWDDELTHSFDITDAVPERKGFVFLGWAEEPEAETAVYGRADGQTARIELTREEDAVVSKTLYAVWQEDLRGALRGERTNFTLRCYWNDGTEGVVEDRAYDDELTHSFTLTETVPERKGFVFLGWARDPNAAEAEFAAGETVTLTREEGRGAELELYAVWKTERHTYGYMLSYDSLSSRSIVLCSEDACSLIVTDEIPVRTGYRFLCWAVEGQEGATYAPGEAVLFTGVAEERVELRLCAQWEELPPAEPESAEPPAASEDGGEDGGDEVPVYKYELLYDSNGGNTFDGKDSTETKESSHTFKITVQKPTRSGYVFVGWAEKNETKAKYGREEEGLEPTITLTGSKDELVSVTLYAIWEPVAEDPDISDPEENDPDNNDPDNNDPDNNDPDDDDPDDDDPDDDDPVNDGPDDDPINDDPVNDDPVNDGPVNDGPDNDDPDDDPDNDDSIILTFSTGGDAGPDNGNPAPPAPASPAPAGDGEGEGSDGQNANGEGGST